MTTSPQINGASASSAQLAGTACIQCGTSGLPLHAAGTVTVPDEHPGVVHDYDVVKCTPCLVVGHRYRTDLLPPDGRGRVMWGIRDLANRGEWVETGGEIERYTLEDGAKGWIARQKYLTEGAVRA